MSQRAEHLTVPESLPPGEAPRERDTDRPPDPWLGTTIDGRYEVERMLGEGGMGLVYQGRHKVLGKSLAIKVLRHDATRDPENLQRFLQEAQAASNIGNPHIIDISDFGTLPDGSTYFVMELLDGTDLATVIANEAPVRPERIVHVARQLCRALAAAHAIGIVHRDLKPENIYLVDRGGEPDFVKVLDFGIAKVSRESVRKITKVGQVFGTPHYMSPEQCAGRSVDHRTDIYALGVIMYEMVTGQVPFDADNLMGILTKQLYEEPVPPSKLVPPGACPPPLERVILRCLKKRADRRYPSMGDLAADLERIKEGLPPRALPKGRPVTPVITLDLGRRRRLPMIVASAIALAAVVTAIVIVTVSWESSPGRDAAAALGTPSPAPGPRPSPRPAPEAEPTITTAVPDPQPPAAGEVELRSRPEGAEIFRDGALLGNTPLAIPKPARGAPPIEYEIRLAGYTPAPVAIAFETVGSVTVTLRAERGGRPPRATGPREGRPPAMVEAEVAVPPPVTTEPAMEELPTPRDQLRDPWAEEQRRRRRQQQQQQPQQQ